MIALWITDLLDPVGIAPPFLCTQLVPKPLRHGTIQNARESLLQLKNRATYGVNWVLWVLCSNL
eukprot:3243523-Karenia_brevis.AAC.1